MKFAAVDVELGTAGRNTSIRINGSEVPVQSIKIDADYRDVTHVELGFPPSRVTAHFSNVDVVGKFGGLDPAVVLRDVAELLDVPVPYVLPDRTDTDDDDALRWQLLKRTLTDRLHPHIRDVEVKGDAL